MEDEQLELLQRLQDASASPDALSVTVGSFKSFAQGLFGGIANLVEGIPQVDQFLRHINPITAPTTFLEDVFGGERIEDIRQEQVDLFTNAAEDINRFSARNINISPNEIPESGLGRFFLQDVPGAIGGTLPGLAASFVNPAFGASVFITQGAGEGASTAREAGFEGTTAGTARIIVGGALGAAEMIPIVKFLRRANILNKGATKNLVSQIFRTSGEEGLTEFFQSLASSGADVALLEDDKSLADSFTQALHEGAVGAVTGGLLGGGQVIPNIKRARQLRDLQDKFVRAGDTQEGTTLELLKNPLINQAIDDLDILIVETRDSGMTNAQNGQMRSLLGVIRGRPLLPTEDVTTALYASGFFGPSTRVPDGDNVALTLEDLEARDPKDMVLGIEQVKLNVAPDETFTPTTDRVSKLWGVTKRLFKQEFGKFGLFPDAIGELKQTQDQWYKGQVQAVEVSQGMFIRAAKDTYGSLENITQEDVDLINAALGDKSKISNLPEAMQEPVARMRGHVDALSKRLVDEGLIEGDLVGTIEDNLGFYLNRQYKLFTDPKWAKNIPNGVVERFRRWARESLLDDFVFAKTGIPQRKGQIKPKTFEDKSNISTRELRTRLQDSTTEEFQEFENYITRIQDKILYQDNNNPLPLVSKLDFLRKELGLFKQRKDIPEPIRQLMGEIKDPLSNYINSALRVANALASHKAAQSLSKDGLGIFFWKEDDLSQPEGLVPVSTAGNFNALKDPFAGLMTYSEIEREFQLRRDEFQHHGIIRGYMKFLTNIKIGKTVGSPQTQARNFIGNAPFAVAHGYFNPFDPLSYKNLQYMNQAFVKMFKAQVRPTGKTAALYEVRIQRMIELGILGQDVRSGELMDQMRSAYTKEFTNETLLEQEFGAGKTPWSRIARKLKSAHIFSKSSIGLAKKLYSANDAVWKAFAWESEVAKWTQLFPDLAIENIEQFAAKRIRNSFPTYDNIPRITKRFRFSPLVASFPSFASEVMRIGWNGGKMIKQELSDPQSIADELGLGRDLTEKEANAIRTSGARRLLGHTTAGLGTTVATAMFAQMWGVDQEDEDDMRRFLPKWQTHNELLILNHKVDSRGKKTTQFLDISYIDPYSYIKTPLIAAASGESFLDGSIKFITEFMDPFLSGEIGTSALLEVASNKVESTGRQIANPTESGTDQFVSYMAHLMKRIEPGVAVSGRKIVQAHKGEAGRIPIIEWGSLLGPRIQTHDPERALSFRVSARNKERRQILRQFTDVVRQRTSVSVQEIMSAYEQMEEVRQAQFEETHEDFKATIRQGVPFTKVLRIATDQRLGEQLSKEVLLGLYKPYKPSSSLIRDLGNRLVAGGESGLSSRILVLKLLQQQ